MEKLYLVVGLAGLVIGAFALVETTYRYVRSRVSNKKAAVDVTATLGGIAASIYLVSLRHLALWVSVSATFFIAAALLANREKRERSEQTS